MIKVFTLIKFTQSGVVYNGKCSSLKSLFIRFEKYNISITNNKIEQYFTVIMLMIDKKSLMLEIDHCTLFYYFYYYILLLN